jgi:uncharacterized protein
MLRELFIRSLSPLQKILARRPPAWKIRTLPPRSPPPQGRLPMSHPCLTCGACCTQYRVAFHWMESDEVTPGGVPHELTEVLDPHRLCMRGTHSKPVRCVALDAEIGVYSRCSIHPNRPSVCREVDASWEYGKASPQCDKAREIHGLPALSLESWAWRDAP